MRVVTWNINSVRIRLSLLKAFIEEQQPDVLCLQEIKCRNEDFPYRFFASHGYVHHIVNGMASYNGVALLSRLPLEDRQCQDFCQRDDARHVAAKIDTLWVHNVYVPAGGDEPDPVRNAKFRHKLDFLEEMALWSATTKGLSNDLLVGDLNVAPFEHDVWSHKQLRDVVCHTPVEVSAYAKLINAGGWIDVARHLAPKEQKLYSWWSYRSRDYRKSNRGRRLDHIWRRPAEGSVASLWKTGPVFHTAWRGVEKPSDHIPVSIDL